MKSGSAPGAAELIWDLGAGGCLSSSRSVRAGSSWGLGGSSEHGAAYIDLRSGSAWWTNVHWEQLVPATYAAFGDVMPGQILSSVEK